MIKESIQCSKFELIEFRNEMITEDAAGLVELTPSDDGTQTSVADVFPRRRQTNGTDVVAEANRLFHAQDGYIVDESSVHVFRMDEDVRYEPHLFVR